MRSKKKVYDVIYEDMVNDFRRLWYLSNLKIYLNMEDKDIWSIFIDDLYMGGLLIGGVLLGFNVGWKYIEFWCEF